MSKRTKHLANPACVVLLALALAVPGSLISEVQGEVPADLDAEQAEQVEEVLRALASGRMIERLYAVKMLFALARSTRQSDWARDLLEIASADPALVVSRQADAAIAELNGLARHSLGAAEAYSTHRVRLAHEEVEELERALSSHRPIVRLRAVKALSALALERSGNVPGSARIRELLETARSDRDSSVARQAEAAVAWMEGVDLVPSSIRTAHRLAKERQRTDECLGDLSAADASTRLRAAKALAALLPHALEPDRILALLDAARADPELTVAAQARSALEDRTTRLPRDGGRP